MKKTKKITKTESTLGRMVGGKLSQMATYSDLFENNRDAVFLLDLETNQVLESNPAVAFTVGIPAKTMEGEDFLSWLDADSRARARLAFDRLRKGAAFGDPLDLVVTTPRGEMQVLEISACRLKLADYCEVIQVIGRNVTSARASARALIEANERLANLSNTDEMTKLFNFRYLKAEMQKEHSRAIRYRRPYSVILCDIDHFKHFNDHNGHLEGDEALRRLAAVLRKRARKTEIVARYGGEEFVVLGLEVGGEQGQLLAEALRASVEAEAFPHGEKQPLGRLTISVGVASYPANGETPEEILRAADKALYLSKEQGRNRVTLANSSAPKKKIA